MKVPSTTMTAAKIIMLRITHTLDHNTGRGDITTAAAKPRLTAMPEAVISANRMGEALTAWIACSGTYVPRGFTRRVGGALAGSSGQGCRG
jgi:hypothetical protein